MAPKRVFTFRMNRPATAVPEAALVRRVGDLSIGTTRLIRAAEVTGWPEMIDHYRELFLWLSGRDYVRAVRYAAGEVDVEPFQQTFDSGRQSLEIVTLTIDREVFEDAYPDLEEGGTVEYHFGPPWRDELPELGAFSMFELHLDESINSLTEPGPHGFTYRAGGFDPH